ncbi:hypothetical protein O6H91_05G043900 [Diphasiastrum complanatum]|uniref:Uncharacterized protein n=14 Tax=Diphasiastrum complanatum TaxID=34168 RepID=A0ACC2DMN3_DIPCM|nr:hypothetical protein O6H91_05G042900 [Diphasiastrum complanatum]KAJ7555528.1 hypothetical protein O6H91_05G043100 [Diphasiastrum complanatum]KAJ7555531.1 hypothetical protein O6H91_05G043300 [Diphasiastrum complanatum]KAJ7555539.1 hypothetical protein O6H91_05G043700 [Diphasiastrum complanatum]KAJ7555549.1 hypothetical protein O6H91_05G043900 [Diphasiastrum complanatum]
MAACSMKGLTQPDCTTLRKAEYLLLSAILLALVGATGAIHAGITRHFDFNITYHNETRLCHMKKIVSVNGMFPGPTIHVNEGDRVVVKVTNFVLYNMSIHWHGIRQLRSAWADGPAYVTQCPIQTGQSYTYNFTVLSQSGTLWWHAHISWMRATVYGAFIIHPKRGVPYPFTQPDEEVPIIIGEWWKSNVEHVLLEYISSGGGPNVSDAYTINGQPGTLYNCSASGVFVANAVPGKTYLLRIINAGLNTEMFFALANHTLTVVEIDASYTKPFAASAILISPGQTTNVLVTADQPVGQYYMAAGPYVSGQGVPFDQSITTAIFSYTGSSNSSSPTLPTLPKFNDTKFATNFSQNLRSLSTAQNPVNVPSQIDHQLLFTVGLSIKSCHHNKTCKGPNGGRRSASVNNVSFVLPKTALLQAHFFNLSGIYTTDFPSNPPIRFNYTGKAPKNLQPSVGTRLKSIPFGSNVQLILQDTNLVGAESHPIHLHGFNFYWVGQGLGNYHPANSRTFNLVDPPIRNTVIVPPGGWAATRFTADNPGVWFLHCHLEVHNTWGLEMAFIVENGKGPLETLPPPPADLPGC